MNRLLLDSTTIVWWDDGSAELGAAARKMIQDAEAVYVSAASEWELSIKAALSKIVLRRSILEATIAAGFESSHLVPARTGGPRAEANPQGSIRSHAGRPLQESKDSRSCPADPVLAEYPISFIDARS